MKRLIIVIFLLTAVSVFSQDFVRRDSVRNGDSTYQVVTSPYKEICITIYAPSSADTIRFKTLVYKQDSTRSVTGFAENLSVVSSNVFQKDSVLIVPQGQSRTWRVCQNSPRGIYLIRTAVGLGGKVSYITVTGYRKD